MPTYVDKNSWENLSQMKMPLWLEPAEGATEEEIAGLKYHASSFRQLINAIYRTSGVIGSNSFKVTVGGNPNTISVASGFAIINSQQASLGAYLVESIGPIEGIVVPASIGSGENMHRVVLMPVDKADAPDATDPNSYGWRIRLIGWSGSGSYPAIPAGSLNLAGVKRTGSGPLEIVDYRIEAQAGGGTAWTNFETLYNTWTVATSTLAAPPRYRRTNAGLVILEGQVSAGNSSGSGVMGGTGEQICVLPLGFRPLHNVLVTVQGRHQAVAMPLRLEIHGPSSDWPGYIAPYAYSSGPFDKDYGFVDFGGVSFYAGGY